MTDTTHKPQPDPLSPSGDLAWEQLTGDNWRLCLGLFGTIIVFSDGWWQFFGPGDAYVNRKSPSVEAAKQESLLMVRLSIDNIIAKLEKL